MAESSTRATATGKSTSKKTTPAKKASPAGSAGTARKATTRKATAKKAAASSPKAAPRKRSTVAAAADRASGERARRSSTPLLTGPSATSGAGGGSRATGTSRAKGSTTSRAKGSASARSAGSAAEPTATTGSKRSAAAGAKRTAPARKRTPPARTKGGAPALRVVPDSQGEAPAARPAEESAKAKAGSSTPSSGQAVVPGLAELVSVLLSAGQLASRTLGQAASSAAGEEWEKRFAEALQYLQRRVTGEYVVDDFGFDEDFTTHTVFPVLRLLKDKWFRIEVRGIENIPDEGGALVVSNHSGTIAIDSVMTQLALHDAHPKHRFLRMLGADLVFQLPVVGDIARKTGSTLAANADANRLLRGGELVGVWPEGFKGVGKPFRERYKLQRFGRGGFVSTAIRAEVPIIPCSVVGAEEVYPMIGNMKTLARLVGAPYAPITPTFPLLGPLGLIPLPSKWIIEFGPPIDTASIGPEAADDPMLVFEFTDQVRETIQQTLYSILVTRRSVFF